MKIIEFFGVSNSGKTYLKNILKKNLCNKKINCFSYKEIIYKFLPLEEKNFIKRFLLKFYLYYKFKLKNKIYLNKKKKKIFSINNKKFILSSLKLKIQSLYFNYLDLFYKKNKNKKFFIKTNILINNLDFNENAKKIFLRWFLEENLALFLIKKNYKKINLVLDSEGFLQRIFIYSYKKKNKKKIIQDYLKNCPIPYLTLITSNKVIKKKKYNYDEIQLNISEQKKIFNLSILVFKKLKIPFLKVNNSNINKLSFKF